MCPGFTSVLIPAPPASAALDSTGRWGSLQSWPIIPINAALTQDGRLMTFGTDSAGVQGGEWNFDVWTPSTGVHQVLPNTTFTDLFCSVQVYDPIRDVIFTAGGDDGRGGATNWGRWGFTSYSTAAGLRNEAPMNCPRWYPSGTVMPNGEIVIEGGSFEGVNGPGVLTPERYTPGVGWTSLTGASSSYAYGNRRTSSMATTWHCGRPAPPHPLPSTTARPSRSRCRRARPGPRLVWAGAITHSFNAGQRFMELPMTGSGTSRTVTAPANGNVASPGLYLLFVLDAAGTPSVARLVNIDVPGNDRPAVIVDGFEDGAVAAPGGWVNYGAGSSFGPWSVVAPVSRDQAGHYGGLGTSGHHLDLDATGQVQRTITGLTPGATYQVQLKYARHLGTSGPVSANVSIGSLNHTWSASNVSTGQFATLTPDLHRLSRLPHPHPPRCVQHRHLLRHGRRRPGHLAGAGRWRRSVVRRRGPVRSRHPDFPAERPPRGGQRGGPLRPPLNPCARPPFHDGGAGVSAPRTEVRFMPQQQWSKKRERQYDHIKSGLEDRGYKDDTAQEIAARTVNKERARSGESKQKSKSSTDDMSSGRRGGKRSGSGPGGRTKEQLYNEAKKKNIKGRSTMTKRELEKAVGR